MSVIVSLRVSGARPCGAGRRARAGRPCASSMPRASEVKTAVAASTAAVAMCSGSDTADGEDDPVEHAQVGVVEAVDAARIDVAGAPPTRPGWEWRAVRRCRAAGVGTVESSCDHASSAVGGGRGCGRGWSSDRWLRVEHARLESCGLDAGRRPRRRARRTGPACSLITSTSRRSRVDQADAFVERIPGRRASPRRRPPRARCRRFGSES